MFNYQTDRETIEWSNTWIENAGSSTSKRILIIGDSVARNFRGSISKFLPNYAVDYIGSSSVFEDTLLYNICDTFFKNEEYQWFMIILNIGGKHGYYLDTLHNQEQAAVYQKGYEQFLAYVKTKCKNIVMLTTTPTRMKKNVKKYDEKINAEIMSRNKIQTKLCLAEKIPTIDLYDYVIQKKFSYIDAQHFKNKKIEKKVAEYIISQLIELKKIDELDFYKTKKYFGIFKIRK